MPFDSLTEAQWQNVQDTLSLASSESEKYHFGASNQKKYIQLYQQSGDLIGLPRYYARRKLGIAYDGVRPRAVPFTWRENMPLRDYQVPAVKAALDEIRRSGGATLQAGCGLGKSCLGIRAAYELGLKTLVLVHKRFFKAQWMKDICKFTHIQKSDVGLIQQKICRIGSVFTVGMVDSLIDRDYPGIYDAFGLILVDENQRYGGERWGTAINRFRAQHILGLTAEASRADGMFPVFHHQIGPLVRVEGVLREMKPRVYLLSSGFEIPEKGRDDSGRGFSFRMRNGKINLSGIQSYLARHEGRNKFIIGVIRSAVAQGRRPVVFCHRSEQLRYIHEHLPQGLSGLFYGEASDAELEEAVEARVVLATYQMASEALNIEELDAMIQASPCGSVRQPFGRIARLLEGKKEPLGIDIVDGGNLALEMLEGRLRQYEKLGYPVGKGS